MPKHRASRRKRLPWEIVDPGANPPMSPNERERYALDLLTGKASDFIMGQGSVIVMFDDGESDIEIIDAQIIRRASIRWRRSKPAPRRKPLPSIDFLLKKRSAAEKRGTKATGGEPT